MRRRSRNQVEWLAAQLLSWYEEHGRVFPWRRVSATNCAKVVAEVLLRRTQAQTVKWFLPQFLRQYPSWRALAAATKSEIGKALKPIGLWRTRSVTLHALSRLAAQHHGRLPADRQTLEAVPGVGEYVASAILLLVHGEPHPLVDTNMTRLLARFFDVEDLSTVHWLAAELVSAGDAATLNWAALDFAAAVCKHRSPCCGCCPMWRHCGHPAGIRLQ